jgi:hypothetical protein
VITGVYTLVEWYVDGVTYRPPLVGGRFIMLDGTITTILHNRSHAQKTMTGALAGTYSLDAGHFSYGYEDVSMVIESPSGASVSHEPLWKGRRSFAVSSDGDAVRLTAVDGQQEFVFNASGFTYSEDGKPLRIWRRVAGATSTT